MAARAAHCARARALSTDRPSGGIAWRRPFLLQISCDCCQFGIDFDSAHAALATSIAISSSIGRTLPILGRCRPSHRPLQLLSFDLGRVLGDSDQFRTSLANSWATSAPVSRATLGRTIFGRTRPTPARPSIRWVSTKLRGLRPTMGRFRPMRRPRAEPTQSVRLCEDEEGAQRSSDDMLWSALLDAHRRSIGGWPVCGPTSGGSVVQTSAPTKALRARIWRSFLAVCVADLAGAGAHDGFHTKIRAYGTVLRTAPGFGPLTCEPPGRPPNAPGSTPEGLPDGGRTGEEGAGRSERRLR